MNKIVFVFLFGLLTKSAIGWQEAFSCPNNVVPCSQYDPNFSTCLTQNFQSIIEAMAPVLLGRNGESLDPYFIRSLALQQNDKSASVDIQLSNIKIEGLSAAVVERDSPDARFSNWETLFGVPVLRISGYYDIKGRVLFSNNLNTQGSFSVTLGNPKLIVNTGTRFYEKGRDVFLDVTKCDVDFILDQIDFQMDKVFNDILSESLAQMELQTNPKKYFNALRPTFRKAASSMIYDYFRKIVNIVPFKCIVREMPSWLPFQG